MQIVRRVTDAAKVASAGYKILVMTSLSWWLIGELIQKGRHGAKPGSEKRVK